MDKIFVAPCMDLNISSLIAMSAIRELPEI